SLLVALVFASAVVAVPHAGAKFAMDSNNKECPANVQRLLTLMCRDTINPDFCNPRVPYLMQLAEKYATFDATTILGGECCSEKRCRLSVLRSLCCIEGVRSVVTDE
ncbi:hypothetical protein PFISCL1PPCAC_26407, partial [Pristionchus fissidentatus]